MNRRLSALILSIATLFLMAGCVWLYDGPRWTSEAYDENIEAGKSYYLHQYDPPYSFPVEDIVYIAGNLPIVISVPHGGYYQPLEIPYHFQDMSSFHDQYTLEMAVELQAAIYNLTGQYAHIIFNKLYRNKLDANRPQEEAYAGGERAKTAFDDYHFFIEEAKKYALAYGKDGISENKCLYIDLHGHSEHDYIEIGYLIDGTAFADDAGLESLYQDSSLELLYDFLEISETSSFSDLIHGQRSFSHILESQEEAQQEFIKCFPNKATDFDYTQFTFKGRYNTVNHSKLIDGQAPANGEVVAGFQLELNLELRKPQENREKACAALAKALIEFLETNYKLDI